MEILNNNKKSNFFENKRILTIILLFLIKPAFFSRVPLLDNLYNLFSVIIPILLILLVIRTNSISKYFIWIVLFFGTILFSTILNMQSVFNYIREMSVSFSMCLIFIIWLRKSPKTLLESLYNLRIYIY